MTILFFRIDIRNCLLLQFNISFNFLMEKSKLIIASFALLAILTVLYYSESTNSDQTAIYEKWKKDFNMKFNLQEDNYRMKIFMENLQAISKHNTKPYRSYNKAVNKFTGLTTQQFAEIYLQKSQIQIQQVKIQEFTNLKGQTHQGQSKDWVSQGAVTRVRDQMSCASSYAFAAVGAIQSMQFISEHNLTQLSAQQVVDCTTRYGNNGCQFGNIVNTFAWTKKWGIQTQSFYPYKGHLQSCMSGGGRYVMSDYKILNNCYSIHDALFRQGPVAVVINADNLKDYGNGLYSDCPTDSRTKPNYSALLVGMNDNAYKLKFSLGLSFGDSGYVSISRSVENPCGICYQGSIPTTDW